MSEVAKLVEPTPAPAAVGGTHSTQSPTTPAAVPISTGSNPGADAITSVSETAPAASTEETVDKGENKVEASPAGEGILGYKGPGLIQSLRFSKRFFWFSDDAFKTDTLDSYLRSEKSEIAYSNAAWAHETGKGLLFSAKRAEDKTAPTGILNLAEISDVTKEGSNEFSFKLNGHKHVFQAASTTERSSWIAAIETNAAQAQQLKEVVVGGEVYKRHFERYNKLGVGAGTTAASLPSLSKSKERNESSAPPRKSLESRIKGTMGTIKKEKEKEKADNSSTSSSDAEKKDKSKSRSRSRKRTSIFGLLSNKKDEQDAKKDAKDELAEEKAEGKQNKELPKDQDKHEKELEQEEKKAEAKASHGPLDVAEAGAATVAAAAPTAAAPSHEGKTEETRPELSPANRPEVFDKKGGKRSSFFGSFFGGRKDVTSPSAEKMENDVAPTDVAPVSEAAPKIEKPPQNKPIDTAAVTAPVDSAIAAHDTPVDSVHAQTTAGSVPSKSPSTPSHKSGVMGFFKRQDSKIEQKKEAKTDESTTSPTALETSAVSDSPTAPTLEGPKPKRRTSIFNSLGTKKEKKSGEPGSETEVTEGEAKKSPLPQKLGGLFRKPSKAVASEETPAQPTSTVAEPAAGTGTAGNEAASSAKGQPILTNGIDETPIQPVNQVPDPVMNPSQEVKTSA